MQKTRKIFSILQAGEMAVTSQAFWTIAVEGLGSQVQKVEHNNNRNKNRVRVTVFCPGSPKLPKYKDVWLMHCVP